MVVVILIVPAHEVIRLRIAGAINFVFIVAVAIEAVAVINGFISVTMLQSPVVGFTRQASRPFWVVGGSMRV